MADDDRPQYQHGVGTIGGSQFHWGSGSPGQYWSIPYGDYPVTPDAPTGAWAQSVGAIPIANNVIPDPLLHRDRIGIMIHSGSSNSLDQLYTQGCFKVAPSEWPAVRSEILKEAANGPLYLHVQPGGVAAFTNTKTFSQAGAETPAANANAAANTTAASAQPSPPAGTTTINSTPAQGSSVLDTMRQNIGQYESGNDYNILGKRTNTGDQAVGRYQVMKSNIPSWTQKWLGQSMTPDQFRADPKAQDAVFNGEFGSYLTSHSPADAASMWFTGQPLAQAGNKRDVLGTTAPQYVAATTKGLDNPNVSPPQAPGPMDPSAQAGGPGAPLGTPGSTVNPPIPTTPGTTINSNPMASLGGKIGDLATNLQKDLGKSDEAQKPPDIKPDIPPAPGARNVSPLLGNPQIYAQRMAGLNQPMTWGGGPPGQMYGAGYGPQNQPVYGTSLMSQLQMLSDPTWMNQMAGDSYG